MTVPAAPAGAIAVIWVGLSMVGLTTVFEPNLTAVTPMKLVPVITTGVPAVRGPAFGDRLVTVGAATKVYSSADTGSDVPPSAVTLTSTVPPARAGATAVIWVALLTT
ncbi:hypothetical protein GCM10027456_71080 [Kineosporia babensis]